MLSPLADLDVVTLSRVQFALTIMFHYLFPPLTIGLGVVLVWLGFRFVRTGDPLYRRAQKFWTKIFALNFALGVATGIVMEFQFGTNWAAYSEFVGDVFGSALAAEGIFAFFLESGFLAVLVFGWDRVGARMHFFSTCMVAAGSIFSAIWIVVANSWQQTPTGHHVVPVYRGGVPWVVDGRPVLRAEIADFWAMLFNPTSMVRLAHVLTGSFIVGGALVCSIGAWYLLRGRHAEFARRSLSGGLLVLSIGAFTALGTGHLHAQISYAYQPAKMAAYEGHFVTGPADLTILGWPDSEAGITRFKLGVPGGYGLLLKNDPSATVVGLDRFRPEDRPPVFIPFVSYRLMVGVGTYLIALSVIGGYYRWRGTLFEKRRLLWVFVVTVIPALVANHAGWVATEVGRQPWVVHPRVAWTGSVPGEGDVATGPDGYVAYDKSTALRTVDAISRSVTGGQVLSSIIGFGLVYSLLFVIWLRVLDNKIREGPDVPERGEVGEGDLKGFFDSAAERPDRSATMTEAKEPAPTDGGETP
ncbi:MAG: cytochrome ubiquinol oxidase subunit I [Isosphaeraceae bacterium]